MDWNVLFSTFGLVFVAELGDKTQLAVLTQTCKYRQPWPVFLGASLALTAVTALGAAGGQVLGQFIPEPVLRILAALAFVAMGALIGWEAARPRTGEPSPAAECDYEGSDEGAAPSPITPVWDWKAFGPTLGLLFVAELGDKTQLAVISLTGNRQALWPVFIGRSTGTDSSDGAGCRWWARSAPSDSRAVAPWDLAVAFVIMGCPIGFGVL